jgi:spermidine/putrescine-binding protein
MIKEVAVMRESQMGRRAFLRGVGAVAGVAATSSLAACGTGSSRGGSGGDGKSIVVRDSGGTYGDANREAIYDPFTKETGIEVQTVNIQYAQLLAQIQQGRPQFDLIDTSMADFVLFTRENALEEIEYDRLKSFKNSGITDSLVTETALGKNYWASVMAYSTDAFGGKTPQSWADFWDTGAFPGSRSLQSQVADIPELEFALLADGAPMDQLYPLDVDRAFASLDRIKDSVKKYWDTGALPAVLLGREEVVACSVWHGRLDELIEQGQPFAYQFNGARRQSNGYAIPKGTANLDAAHQLIDFALRPEVQAHYAEVYPMGPVVPAAYDRLSSEAADRLVSSPERLENGFDVDVTWWIDNNDLIDERWQEWTHA